MEEFLTPFILCASSLSLLFSAPWKSTQKLLVKMLVKLTTGVNFTNIYMSSFLCKSSLIFPVSKFLYKEINTKAACKILVKSTTGNEQLVS